MGVLDQVPILYVAVEGRTAPVDLTRKCLRLEVDQHTKKATKITLVFSDTDEVLAQRRILSEGREIVVRWGYVGNLSRPVGGIIDEIKSSYGDKKVTVMAYGKELALSTGPIRRAFRGQTFRSAVESIAQSAGITVEWLGPNGINFDAQVIADEHAWSWLLRKTAELGLEMEMVGNTLTVQEPRTSDRPAVILHYNWRNAELLDFDPQTKQQKRKHRHESQVAAFFDPASGQVLSHAAGDPTTTRQSLAARRLAAEAQRTAVQRTTPTTPTNQPSEDTGELVYHSMETGEELPTIPTPITPPTDPPRTAPTVIAADVQSARQHIQQVAQGKWRAQELRAVQAKAKSIGLPELVPGRVVQIVGCASTDAGLWYVDGTRHEIGDNGYVVDLELKRDGINGGHGRRHSAPARPNEQASNINSPAQQNEPRVTLNLNNGRET